MQYGSLPALVGRLAVAVHSTLPNFPDVGTYVLYVNPCEEFPFSLAIFGATTLSLSLRSFCDVILIRPCQLNKR